MKVILVTVFLLLTVEAYIPQLKSRPIVQPHIEHEIRRPAVNNTAVFEVLSNIKTLEANHINGPESINETDSRTMLNATTKATARNNEDLFSDIYLFAFVSSVVILVVLVCQVVLCFRDLKAMTRQTQEYPLQATGFEAVESFELRERYGNGQEDPRLDGIGLTSTKDLPEGDGIT